MQYSKLDYIVKGFLLNRGYTLHWYVQFLKYASDCLRELSMDDLKIVNTVVLTLNQYYAVTIPSDCLDWIAVGLENGQYIKPLTQVDTLNRAYNYDSNGNPKPYPQTLEGVSDLAFFGVPYLTWYINSYNSRGENIGGIYGFRTDGAPYIYQVMKERNEIQFDSSFPCKRVVLTYVSDGRSSTAASMVDTYAEKTIEDWMDWQHAEHNRTIPSGEKERKFNKYVGSRTVLRGREDNLSVDDITAIWRNNYTATVKT
jgi:hypothetical protein